MGCFCSRFSSGKAADELQSSVISPAPPVAPEMAPAPAPTPAPTTAPAPAPAPAPAAAIKPRRKRLPRALRADTSFIKDSFSESAYSQSSASTWSTVKCREGSEDSLPPAPVIPAIRVVAATNSEVVAEGPVRERARFRQSGEFLRSEW